MSVGNWAVELLAQELEFTITVDNGTRYFGPKQSLASFRPEKGSEVFVGRLPDHVFEDVIYEFFSTVGEIYRIKLLTTLENTNRGYCFVKYMTPSLAQRAVKLLKGRSFLGHTLFVEISTDHGVLQVTGTLAPDHKIITDLRTNKLEVIAVHKRDPEGFLLRFKEHQQASVALRELGPRAQELWGAMAKIEWQPNKFVKKHKNKRHSPTYQLNSGNSPYVLADSALGNVGFALEPLPRMPHAPLSLLGVRTAPHMRSEEVTASQASKVGTAFRTSEVGTAFRTSVGTASRTSEVGTASRRSVGTASWTSVGTASRTSEVGTASWTSMGTASRTSEVGTASRTSEVGTASQTSEVGTASQTSVGTASRTSEVGTASRTSVGTASWTSVGTASRTSEVGTASRTSEVGTAFQLSYGGEIGEYGLMQPQSSLVSLDSSGSEEQITYDQLMKIENSLLIMVDDYSLPLTQFSHMSLNENGLEEETSHFLVNKESKEFLWEPSQTSNTGNHHDKPEESLFQESGPVGGEYTFFPSASGSSAVAPDFLSSGWLSNWKS